jgi:hypothetical protein
MKLHRVNIKEFFYIDKITRVGMRPESKIIIEMTEMTIQVEDAYGHERWV